MRLEIEGELLEIQGSIERALEIIETNKWEYIRNETSATKEYLFSSMWLGKIGKLKISILPKKKTELYSYSVDYPDDRWLIKYFPDNFPFYSVSAPLQQLLSVYSWQIENNIFDLTSTELYQLGFSNKPVDWGWERYGLGDIELRKQAEEEFKDWRQKVFDLRNKDLNKIFDVILTQIRLDNPSFEVVDGKILKPTPPESSPMIAEKEQSDSGKVEKVNKLQARWDKMSPKIKSNFRKAWKIWGQMLKAYRKAKLDGQTEDAQPKIKDWQTKITKDLRWNVSESRLRNVKKMGESKIIK